MDIKNEFEKLIPYELFENLGERAKKAEEEKKQKRESRKRKADYQTNYRKKQLERTIKLPIQLLSHISMHYKLTKSETLRSLFNDFSTESPDYQSEFILRNITNKAPSTATELKRFNVATSKKLDKSLHRICTKYNITLQSLTRELLADKYTQTIRRICISPAQRNFRYAAISPGLLMSAPHSDAFRHRTLEENLGHTENPRRSDPVPLEQQPASALENHFKDLNQDQSQRYLTPARTPAEKLDSNTQPESAASSNTQPGTEDNSEEKPNKSSQIHTE